MSIDWYAVRAAQRTQYKDTPFHFNPTERLPKVNMPPAKGIDWKRVDALTAKRIAEMRRKKDE